MDFLTSIIIVLLVIQYVSVIWDFVNFNEADYNMKLKELLINFIPFVIYITLLPKLFKKVKTHIDKMVAKDTKRKVDEIFDRTNGIDLIDKLIKVYVNENRNIVSKVHPQFALDEEEFLKWLNGNADESKLNSLQQQIKNEKLRVGFIAIEKHLKGN